MATQLANAYPRKHFFLEMFTRDISLEDCILDLIDNSIDGLVRSQGIDVAGDILKANGKTHAKLPSIDVRFSEKFFEIVDTCGGIERSHAIDEVFNFGHGPKDELKGTLGVYGIGLKRAIFKIGNHFHMESRTASEGFAVDLNVKKWSEKDDGLEDWRIPITFTKGSGTAQSAGTTIRVTDLRREVVMRLNDGTLETKLRTIISQTYGLFINRYVGILVNGKSVEPFTIPIGESEQVKPAHDEFTEGKVHVRLFASLAARGQNREWPVDPAGWYALCNGRIVVAGDKTDLTGWGSNGFPQFHGGKFRGFIGIASFQSKDALALPWTTTKRGLNRESEIYQAARNRMRGVARPIITFLDKMYADAPEELAARNIAEQVKPTALSLISKTSSAFSVRMPPRQIKTTTRICYDAERTDIERIRKHLKKPSWGANSVGKHTFDHFLKMECPE